MKNAQMKLLGISFVLMVILSIMAVAITVTTDSPADNIYSLNGKNIPVTCTASPSSGQNITNVSVFTNRGVWSANSTHTTVALIGTTVTANFTLVAGTNQSIADGTDFIYSCASQENGTNYTFSGNRTVNVEYPPTVTLNDPVNGGWQSGDIGLNWTVSSAFGSIGFMSPFQCEIWSNETGTWASKATGIFVTNGTEKKQSQTFLNKADIRWGVKCGEFNDFNVANFSQNRTIRMDRSAPSVSISNTDGETSDRTFDVTYTVTDDFPAQAILYGNFNTTSSSALSVMGRMEAVSGSNTFNVIAQDGTWTYLVSVNNTANTFTNSSSKTVTVDTLKPNFLTIANSSVTGSCQKMNVSWTTNESTNYTIYFGTTVDTTSSASSSSRGTANSYLLDFGFNAETNHFVNITSCDAAGNCNTSNQFTIKSPARVCSGWTHYAVYESSINLSTIASQSGASLVYFWNQTRQNWVFYSSGSSSNAGTLVGTGTQYPVVQLYTETNNSWYRSQANRAYYRYNLTVGDNYLVVPEDYTFGNLTESFMNSSRDFPGKVGVAAAVYGPFNVTYFAGFNSSNQNWVNHQFNFSWSNSSMLKERTPVEVFWVWSDFNVTWNGTAIDINWSRY